MTKASVPCKSCGEENSSDSEFCINCGTKLVENMEEQLSEEVKRKKEYQNWKRSVPYTLSAAIFIIFIDLVTGSGLNWSYWVFVPILLFAIIAPYISFKMD